MFVFMFLSISIQLFYTVYFYIYPPIFISTSVYIENYEFMPVQAIPI